MQIEEPGESDKAVKKEKIKEASDTETVIDESPEQSTASQPKEEKEEA